MGDEKQQGDGQDGAADELREDDVMREDVLDDRVEEGDGLGRVEEGEEFPPIRRD